MQVHYVENDKRRLIIETETDVERHLLRHFFQNSEDGIPNTVEAEMGLEGGYPIVIVSQDFRNR